MPTKKKRVGFIPREGVMKIINELSIENNLSNSKIVGILVEEALSIRGIYNKKTGKESIKYEEKKNYSNYFSEDYSDLKVDDKFPINTKLVNHKRSNKKELLKQRNKEAFDLNTYKKFISFLKFQEMMEEFNNE